MKLSEDCLVIPVDRMPDGIDFASVGVQTGLAEVIALNVVDHPHKGGEGLESSVVVVLGSGAAANLAAVEESLMAAGVQLERGASRQLELRGVFDASKGEGDHFVAVQVDFVADRDDAETQEAEFDEWYTYEHMGDVSRADGIHRAFRGAMVDSEPRHHWCWYETDDPSVFMDSRKGKAPWGGLWLSNIDQSTFRRSYFEISARWNKEGR